MGAARGDWEWAVTARSLYLVSMAIFLVTISIGIPNGLDIITFDRNQLLTHVHSGTIGWLTLSLVAATFVLFRRANPRLATALAVVVPLYIAAFYTGSFALRALMGTILLVLVVWLAVWTWRAFLAGPRALPQLRLTPALATLTPGAAAGVPPPSHFFSGKGLRSGGGHAA